MPDYSKGKIYSIRSYKTDDIYIGSTCRPLCVRMACHRSDYKSNSTVRSKEILKYDDAYIELIEEFPCEKVEQLHKREGEIIRNTKCVNKIIPCRTLPEYYQDNKNIILEKHKIYREDNKDKCKEYSKEYYENNQDKIKEYRENHKDNMKDYMKDYYEDNKNILIENSKEYYLNNKDKVLEYKKEYQQLNKEQLSLKAKKRYKSTKINCNCGSIYTEHNKNAHYKTIKHISYEESLK